MLLHLATIFMQMMQQQMALMHNSKVLHTASH